jgi:hypothetical protein
MRQVSRIILHWLGEGDSRNYVSQSSVDGIREYHTKINGWSDIGYHWLIDRNGILYEGRPEDIVGAHTFGANTGSIGINLMYGTKDKILTSETIGTLIDLLRKLCKKYDITPSKDTIIGHSDIMATECPGIAYNYLPGIISTITGRMSGAPEPMKNPPETKEIGRVTISYKGKLYDGLMINNQSYISVSTLSKMMSLPIEWDGKTRTVTINK